MASVSLTSEPNLGSMVITADGVYDHRINAPFGSVWPEYTVGSIVITDRAGAELATLDAEVGVGKYANTIRWMVQPEDLVDVPNGANFEIFVTILDEELQEEVTYKVQYGRVIRKQVSFPLNPTNTDTYTGALFTDSVGLRSQLGPFWIMKYGQVVMHDNSMYSKPYGMGNDWIFWDKAACHWYSPLKSDTQKVQLTMMKWLGGAVAVVLCSNYAMTNWIGVLFDTTNNLVRPVTGSVNGAQEYVEQAVTVGDTMSTSPDTYTVSYDYPTNTISVYKGVSLTPLMSWVDSTNQCAHGLGHRYTGLIYRGSFLGPGPQVTYWSAKDQ